MPWLTVRYKRLHYTDFPPTDSSSSSSTPRETFILHHGLGSSQNFYTPLVPALTAAGFRVIAFDTTGAARSPYTQVEQTIETLAADVLGILDHFSIPRAIVVGHSMGGIVAAHLAAEHADRVVAAVLIGPVYPTSAVAAVFEKRIAAVEAEDAMDGMANSIPAAATAASASSLARAMIRELLLAQSPAGYVSNCRVIAGARPPAYPHVKVPTLLLAGEEDKSAPLESSKKMFGELGAERKRMVVLPKVGHWHAIEAPEAVGNAVIDFYNQEVAK
ncbi:3-oxoadipate enol-lactone hydrolase [Phyllosticta capitalensis]|uniref:3-oxoadipate enol-lactone hydrolase n=1 Tax=Phyllosticta capitalensis TaxID=121624 RepID=A0ABR1YEV6_9PEZI